MPEKLLSLQDICMSFAVKSGFLTGEKRLQVLRNINLDIEQGEIVVVVGESGCGKTTIGKIITGLLKPTSGKMIFNGRDLYRGFFGKLKKMPVDLSEYEREAADMAEKERKAFIKRKTKEKIAEYRAHEAEFENSVQFVQQDSYAALNPVRTIYQSLYAPIRNKNRKWTRRQIDDRIQELMQLVGLFPAEQFLYKYPHQLSGGQRQRILMARAVSLDPKLIVADEPVSMIDVSLRLSILNLMKELNAKLGLSFVYITHDLSTARYIAYHGRICVMYLGEIVEMGTVEDVVASPRHPYTQALFGAVPVPDPKLAREQPPVKIKSMEVGNLAQRKNGCPFYARCPYARDDCENIAIGYEQYGNSKVLCKHLDEVPLWDQRQ